MKRQYNFSSERELLSKSKARPGQTLLSYAAQKGYEAIVELLLTTGKVGVDAKTKRGWTALRETARRGHEAVVRLLLEHKADVDTKDGTHIFH